MIGHQMLLFSGDSTSRVLPVQKEAGRYKIQLDSDFQFAPEELVKIIDQNIKKAQIATHYLVEVEDCSNHQTIYSYEMGNSLRSNIVPCAGRKQPKACYQVFITILKEDQATAKPVAHQASQGTNYFLAIPLTCGLLLLTGLLFFRRNGSSNTSSKSLSHIIEIGKYRLDQRNMMLVFDDKQVELSGKESDLLLLLYSAANTTLEREHILKKVWGDEGNYIGRTLDVFVSKLRKKLANDSNIKIVNIRGIGYKLILNT
ncbi:hypothetical protein BKI52_33215 [marine bacterium AO1-C]|nr:hypothetical protein BKI52_33215 [marine bacterium AO1-C]